MHFLKKKTTTYDAQVKNHLAGWGGRNQDGEIGGCGIHLSLQVH